jgi:hypothetical protein
MKSSEYFKKIEKKILGQLNSLEYNEGYLNIEPKECDKNHFFEVVKIASELWSENEPTEVPVALRIAALCHDIDRIYPKRQVNTKDCTREDYASRKGVHSGNCALIFSEINSDLPRELLQDCCFLILRHELGGDKNKEMNLLDKRDDFTQKYNLHLAANYLFYADKLSFFYSNINEYKKRGKERLMSKIEFSLKGLPSKIKNKIFELKFEDDLINECLNKLNNP